MNINKFIEELEKINIFITDTQIDKLNKYYELLVEWNKKMNLTGITDYELVLLKHFYDSLTLNKIVNLNNIENLCDIGTGAGFPGMVIKIVFPNIHVTLVDSLGKRIVFLKEVAKKLNLDKIDIINARAEEYAKDVREKYDIVTARAVAPLNILLEYSIPLVKIGGNFISMKSDIKDEIIKSKKIMSKLGCEISDICEFILPLENSKRVLIKVNKRIKTNKLFPRKYSEIKHRPII